MSAKNKHRVCAYCRQLKKATVDHVPPKLLLEQPFPPNLLTVPACRDCNEGFKADDEYTRTVIGLDVRASKNATAQSNLPAIIRSLQRPDARGFAEYIVSQSTPSAILGPGQGRRRFAESRGDLGFVTPGSCSTNARIDPPR